MVFTYDPKQVSMIFAGKIMSGFGDGTFIKASRNSQTWNQKVGVDGLGTRAKSNDQSGKVEITLMQSSQSNDDLSAILTLDENANTGTGILLLKDGSGRTLLSAVTAWIQKPTDVEFAKEASTRTWILETDQLIIANIGGN